MKNTLGDRVKLIAAIQLGMIVTWVSHLVDTDAYFSVYALCAVAAAVCLCDNVFHDRHMTKGAAIWNLTLSALLSLAATLANYPIFQRIRNLEEVSMSTNNFLNAYEAVLTFLCGIVVCYQIFQCVASRYPAQHSEDNLPTGKYPVRVFFGVLGSVWAIYLIYLFLVAYPGSVTSDSIWQINQYVGNAITNHHPYWHTMSIKFFVDLGFALFQDGNAAAATFNVFQSLAMAYIFAYTIVTLYQYRVPKVWLVVAYACFAFLPNHITYSCTVWKDVPFGGAVLLLVVSMFRIMRNVGKRKWLNYVLLMVGGIGTGILRSNGFAAMAAAFLILVLFFRKRCKTMLLPWLGCLVLSWVLTGPIPTALGVANVNFIEALSVPLQQVARVITEGYELTAEEVELIDKIVDIEEIPELYQEWCSDHIKDEIRRTDYPYLLEHKKEFFDLWIQIGMRYPWEYVEAWVEETKGYWNGGYDYYIYAQYVDENDYGMYMVEQHNLIHDLVKAYFTFTRETVLFEPIQSIGLHVWVLSILCFLNLLHNRREFLLTVPVLAVVFTLWVTTPVFSEFRYAYCVFTTMPFLLPVSACRHEGEEL